MTPSIFESNYANQYDLLYGDKDYEAECDLIEKIFRQHGARTIETILDFGCGTGNHVFPLARRGYTVTGVDISADMLLQAKEKARSVDYPPPTFHLSDIKKYEAKQKYDVVLMMFAVLGYQLQNMEIIQALDVVRKCLKPQGIFIFDVWYGPAVLAIKPSDRMKVIQTEDGQLIRFASGSLDTYSHVAEVNYHLWRIHDQGRVQEMTERHQMRYFFAQELSQYLYQANMEMIMLSAFSDVGVKPSENDWNALGVAKLMP